MALSTLRQQNSKEKPFLWTIPNFGAMRDLEEVVNQQEVTFEMGREIGLPTKWKFNLQSNLGEVGLYAKLLDYPKRLTAVYAQIQIGRNKFVGRSMSSTYLSTQSINKNMANGSEHRFDNFIEKNETPVLNNGELSITVTILLFSFGNSPLTFLLAEYEGRFVDQVRADWVSIRSNPPDIANHRVTIVSKDGKELVVEPCILAARSPVFRSMFESKMSEAESGVVKVEDMDSGSLDVLLEFCHSGVLREKWKEVGVVEGLLYGVGKYMLEDLKEFLGKAAALVCTKENCGKLFSLSRALGLKEAEAGLLDYFKWNMAEDVEQIVAFVQDLDLSVIPEESVSALGECANGEIKLESQEEEVCSKCGKVYG